MISNGWDNWFKTFATITRKSISNSYEESHHHFRKTSDGFVITNSLIFGFDPGIINCNLYS